MILVICGGKPAQRDAIIRYFMEFRRGQVQTICLSHIKDVATRVARIDFELGPYRSFKALTIVNHPTSIEEVEKLRSHNDVVFAHVYGPLVSTYSEITIRIADLFVTDSVSASRPKHVLTPEELLSEIEIKRQLKKSA